MSRTSLLKQEENKTHMVSVFRDVEPQKLGVYLSKYFNSEEQANQLFCEKKRIDYIKNNEVYYLGGEYLSNLWREGVIDIFNTNRISYMSVQQYIELLATEYPTMEYLYVYHHKKWICYTGYILGEKRIVEEIHLENLCYDTRLF